MQHLGIVQARSLQVLNAFYNCVGHNSSVLATSSRGLLSRSRDDGRPRMTGPRVLLSLLLRGRYRHLAVVSAPLYAVSVVGRRGCARG